MIVLKYLLTFVEIICCFLLIGAILMQRTRSQGIGLAFGSGIGESVFGTGAVNVLMKITIVLSIIFLINTTLLGLIWTKTRVQSHISLPKSVKVEKPSSAPKQTMPAGAVSETVQLPSSIESQPVIPVIPEATQPDITKPVDSVGASPDNISPGANN